MLKIIVFKKNEKKDVKLIIMLKKFPVKNKRPILPDILTCNRKTGLGNTMGIEN